MNNDKLPTDDLKKYGIMDSNNSFTNKLGQEEINLFLSGDTIIAENDKSKLTFTLRENNSKLDVKMFENERSYNDIVESLADNPKSVQYNYETEVAADNQVKNVTRTAFLMKDDMHIYSFDMLSDTKKLTNELLERKDEQQLTIYKTELQKLQSYLQDKIDKYPEAAKQITENLNIVSKEINSVNNVDLSQNADKSKQSDIRLDVNDPDLYQDVNSERERNHEEERSRSFKR